AGGKSTAAYVEDWVGGSPQLLREQGDCDGSADPHFTQIVFGDASDAPRRISGILIAYIVQPRCPHRGCTGLLIGLAPNPSREPPHGLDQGTPRRGRADPLGR